MGRPESVCERRAKLEMLVDLHSGLRQVGAWNQFEDGLVVGQITVSSHISAWQPRHQLWPMQPATRLSHGTAFALIRGLELLERNRYRIEVEDILPYILRQKW